MFISKLNPRNGESISQENETEMLEGGFKMQHVILINAVVSDIFRFI